MGVLNASFLGLVLSSSLIWAQVSPREEIVNRAIENLMCTCGCPHLIGQCGDECGVAPQLINEISALVDRGSTEDEVYAAFEAKYGLVVLAVPRMEGFNMLLWILPFLGIFIGAVVVFVVCKRLKPSGRDDGRQRGETHISSEYRELIDREVGR